MGCLWLQKLFFSVKPQGRGKGSELAQEGVGVEEGPSGNVASLFLGVAPEEAPRSTLKPLPSGPGSASRRGQSPPPADTIGPLPLGLLPEQLMFHLHLGPQEAQPPLVALFQASARHTAHGASGSPGGHLHLSLPGVSRQCTWPGLWGRVCSRRRNR